MSIRWAWGLVSVGLCGCNALSSGIAASPSPSPGLGFADPARVASGVAVTVMKGPISPVSYQGQINALPVVGAVVAISTSGGQFVGNLTTGPGGLASASLEPGSYVASVSVCPGVMRLAAPASFSLSAGQLATMSLECDTGIR